MVEPHGARRDAPAAILPTVAARLWARVRKGDSKLLRVKSLEFRVDPKTAHT